MKANGTDKLTVSSLKKEKYWLAVVIIPLTRKAHSRRFAYSPRFSMNGENLQPERDQAVAARSASATMAASPASSCHLDGPIVTPALHMGIFGTTR